MNYSKYRFNLDMQSYISQISLPVRQHDTGIVLRINLTDGGVPYVIKDGCRAVFYARKADGNPLMNDCVIEKNTTICYELTQQTTACSGVVDCEIRLYGTDGNLITTPRFILVVDSRVVHDDDFPVSDSEQTILDNIILSETARQANEVEREKAEAERQRIFTEAEADRELAFDEAHETARRAKEVTEEIEAAFESGELQGKSPFFAYSAFPDGTDYTLEWHIGQTYIGIAVGLEAPTDKSGYVWTLFLAPVSFNEMTDVPYSYMTVDEDGYLCLEGDKSVGVSVNDKLDKITSSGNQRVYAISADGSQTVLPATIGLINVASIVLRNGNGNAFIATPINDDHIANKKYVDDKFANMSTVGGNAPIEKGAGENSVQQASSIATGVRSVALGDNTYSGNNKGFEVTYLNYQDVANVGRTFYFATLHDQSLFAVTGDMVVAELVTQGETGLYQAIGKLYADPEPYDEAGTQFRVLFEPTAVGINDQVANVRYLWFPDYMNEGDTVDIPREGTYAEGKNTQSVGVGSHAEGLNTVAGGRYSHAEGEQGKAIAINSHVEGYNGRAEGPSSHCEGSNSVTTGHSAHAGGYGSKATAKGAFAHGYKAEAQGEWAVALGNQAIAERDCAFAVGYKTMAMGTNSFACGEASVAAALGAHAEGYQTSASGSYSHAEGWNTSAKDQNAHAEGRLSIATALAAHAEGCNTTASGTYSHAEGYNTIASGSSSHAEGSSKASGQNSHAEGTSCEAKGHSSHASGYNSIATETAQYVVGKNNAENKDALFIVGNGKTSAARSNAFAVISDTNGNAALQVGKTVITESQLNALIALLS